MSRHDDDEPEEDDDEPPLPPRRLSSSCFQLEGRELRLEAARLVEVERAEEAEEGASRQLEPDDAGAEADEPPLPPRRLSSSAFQLDGRLERWTGAVLAGEVGRADEADDGESRQLEEPDEAGAGESLPRRLASSCFQFEGRLERWTGAFLAGEVGRADEADDGDSRQPEPDEAGAGELLPPRRLSSSWRQLAGSTERVGLTRLADVERLRRAGGGRRRAATRQGGGDSKGDVRPGLSSNRDAAATRILTMERRVSG